MPAGLDVTVPLPVPASVTDNGKFDDVVLNVAVTFRACVIATVQVSVVPVHAPLHPPKVDPVDAAAVSVTFVAFAKFAVHVPPQLIPAGLEVTVPVPVPIFVIASANEDELLNVAVTLRAAVMDTVQVPVTLVHAPLQPANVEPLAAAAVSVTEVLFE